MQLFYHPGISANDKQIVFPKEESRHIVKVLRKKTGDLLNVTNGSGSLFKTEIITATAHNCVAKIIEVKNEENSPHYLHLAVAPTKMNDRYEWFLEKATEIGVQEITPVICDHSERRKIKSERYERVIQSAMKQSLHLTIPVLNEATNFAEFIKTEISGDKFIAHCDNERERKSLKRMVKARTKTTILIGPEGDFSPEEIFMALENNWVPVSLGKSRLRTETGAIAACHTVALANEE